MSLQVVEAVLPRKLSARKDAVTQAVNQSETPAKASERIGISKNTLYRLMKRYEVSSPSRWKEHRAEVLLSYTHAVPNPVIWNEAGRIFVGTLVGAEGAITCTYARKVDETTLAVVVELTDREWIAKFAEVVGLSPPPEYGRLTLPGNKPKFRRTPIGLRAVRVLREIMPHLYGLKKKEAQAGVDFFAPTGYRDGLWRPQVVWGNVRGTTSDAASEGLIWNHGAMSYR